MKYYIIAGEASGDLHGSNLMKALQKIDVNAEFRFWGGNLMQAVNNSLVKHYKDLAFMGFIEVVMNLRTITKNLAFCKKDIEQYNPDTIIFIDYPGFNLRIAKWAKQKGYKTHYYISPQIWAWKENRIKDIKRDVDHMHVILPFEKEFYEDKHNYPVNFVGHPLIDAIGARQQVDEYSFRAEHELNKKLLLYYQEAENRKLKKMLSVMLSVVDDFPGYQFVIAGAPSQDYSFYEPFITNNNVSFISNRTYDLLSVSYAALVTSGTATLETALFKVPEVVCYKGSWLSYQIGKRLVKHIKYISLVNLIMDKEVVTELIQDDFNTKRLKQELKIILDDYQRVKFFLNYYDLEKKLGGKGASNKTAELIFKSLN